MLERFPEGMRGADNLYCLECLSGLKYGIAYLYLKIQLPESARKLQAIDPVAIAGWLYYRGNSMAYQGGASLGKNENVRISKMLLPAFR